mmetsp:Transcript_7725/g.14555  ORF Transcript_7725/g.14555 Transcript_7725/m.14555 type:complete len:266 (-) Transcript_7725:136-933(-)
MAYFSLRSSISNISWALLYRSIFCCDLDRRRALLRLSIFFSHSGVAWSVASTTLWIIFATRSLSNAFFSSNFTRPELALRLMPRLRLRCSTSTFLGGVGTRGFPAASFPPSSVSKGGRMTSPCAVWVTHCSILPACVMLLDMRAIATLCLARPTLDGRVCALSRIMLAAFLYMFFWAPKLTSAQSVCPAGYFIVQDLFTFRKCTEGCVRSYTTTRFLSLFKRRRMVWASLSIMPCVWDALMEVSENATTRFACKSWILFHGSCLR